MAFSCEQRYFVCRASSRACREEAAAAHTMDTAPSRALFLSKAESLCSPNSTAHADGCALSLLHLYSEYSTIPSLRKEERLRPSRSTNATG